MISTIEEMKSKISDEIQKVIDDFDLNYERSLEFDEQYKKYLDSLIEMGTLKEWGKIAVTCRRMIICDRELDLKKGTKLMNDSLVTFKKLKPEDRPYEAIRYANTCGLISYRSGDYSSALEYFKDAEEMAKANPSMHAFVPDMTSNVIRTDFEFFRHTLGEIKSEDRGYYKERFHDDFLEKLNDAFNAYKNEWLKYQSGEKKLKLIYGHGMASLYHNLGECYYIKFKTFEKIDESEANKALEKARRCHKQSLEWGERVGDIYRQLQSKRYLSELATDEEEKKRLEEEVLEGNWVRGKQIVYQHRIEREKVSMKINDMIKELKCVETEKDKIGMLYNLNAIKTPIKKGVKGIKDEKGPLTLSDIADKKIGIAKNLRDNLSFLLYRRQAINLIRDDVFYKINQFWEKGNYEECINLSEDYNCRSLIELSRISRSGKLGVSGELREKIAELKELIFKQIRNRLKDTKFLSLTLDIKSDKDLLKLFLKLLFAYEKVLEKPFKDLSPQITDKNIYEKLVKKLKELYQEQGQETAVLRFWTLEEKKVIRAILITRNGIQKHWQDIKLDIEGTVNTINFVNGLLQREIVKNCPLSKQQELYNMLFEEMAPFSNDLKLYDELTNIKNLFIIPDGKLFQLPLHLLGKDGQDLRKNSSIINVYYCPTLNHLLTSPIGNSATIGKESNYLWVFCPTSDLYKENGETKPELSILDIEENGKNNVILKYDKATLESFFNAFETNKFTHIGFSTHGLFYDKSKDAYTSPILLNDSFLTPYDVLFSLDLRGVQTVFLGACQVGSSKYTDENEAIGLVTAFLAKNAVSVIAPLYTIDYPTHNLFIETVNKSNIFNFSEPWNLADILSRCESPYILSPFVQYTNIGIVERGIKK